MTLYVGGGSNAVMTFEADTFRVVDENGDGVIDQDEVYQVSPDGMLAMNDPTMEDALYEGMPDYTNDADVSSLV